MINFSNVVAYWLPGLRNHLALFFYLIVATALTVVFPLISALRRDLDLLLYTELCVASIVLFLAVTYFFAQQTRPSPLAPTAPTQHADRLVLCFFIGLLVYSLLFLEISLRCEVFYRRIGFEGLTTRSLSMNWFELFVHRSFAETATALIAAGLMGLACVSLQRSTVITAALCLLIAFCIQFAFVLINNRFQVAIFTLSLLAAALHSGYFSTVRSTLHVLLMTVLVTGYLFQVTENLRNQFDLAGCASIRALLPGLSLREAARGRSACLQARTEADIDEIVSQEVYRPWDERLDSMGLIVSITRPAFVKGFGFGKFWREPLALNYYAFFDKDKYRNMKLNLRTTPKVAIIQYYLNKRIADIPSSILSDAYANFWLAGFVLAGLIVGVTLGFVDVTLSKSTSLGALVLAFFVLDKVLYVEKEMLTLVVGLFKFGLVPLLAAALLWRVPVYRLGTATTVAGSRR